MPACIFRWRKAVVFVDYSCVAGELGCVDYGYACQNRAAREEAEDGTGETLDEPAAVVAVLGVADGSCADSDCAACYGANGHPARRVGQV